MLTAIQGFVLVESGNIEEGMPVIVNAVTLARKNGYHCLLDHVYALQRSLGGQALKYNRASTRLGDALR